MTKQGHWNKVKRAIFGRPVTHADQQAARTTQTPDSNSDVATSTHSSRFNGLGNSRERRAHRASEGPARKKGRSELGASAPPRADPKLAADAQTAPASERRSTSPAIALPDLLGSS